MADRELLVRILGDDRDLQRALGNTEKRVTAIDNRMATFGKNIRTAFAAAGISVGVAALFKGIGDSVEAASALNEEVSKSRQIFGDSSRAIETWAQTTATGFGVSERAALSATGTFGNLFRVVEIAPDQAAAMSRALVELAADLASFNNADPTEVLTALRSGLAGEAEPLRRFGVFLSEARVQMQAMAATGKDNIKELTNQEKALARYNIILQDTSIAQGDFERTSGGLANQTRILRAQLADLSAELGSNLVPILITATRAANGLFHAFDALGTGIRFEGITPDDLSSLQDLRDRLRGVVGDSNLMVQALDDAIRKIEEFNRIETPRPDDRPGPRGPGAIDITNAQVDVKDAERAARQAKAGQARRQKAFDEFIKGQGLKLDQAELTRSLQDDLAVLRAIEAAILRRIANEGRTFKLVEQLTAVRLEIANTAEQSADDAKEAGVDAFDAILDALNLELERAQATQSLQDDQAALRAIEQRILKRIAAEGQTTDLLRQLHQVREEQADVARRLNAQRREKIQGKQFAELGLTDEGQERAPSTAGLRRRRDTLEDRIKGTSLDTKKNRQILENAQKVLSEKFGKVGREVRLAIEGMFDDIAAGFKSGDKTLAGPLTKTTSLNTKKFLQGLGLSEEELNALRGRLSSFNSGGTAPAGFLSSGVNVPSGGGFGGAPVIVQSNVTVTLDGKKVGQAVTKEQQKSRRRNPRQKRGPNRRGGEG